MQLERNKDFKMRCAREREMLMIKEQEYENSRNKTNPRSSRINYFLKPTESGSSINERNQKQKFEFAKIKNRFSNEFFIGENQK